MAVFKTIQISDIFIPERLRDLEEDHALAIAQSIVEHGLLNPITVRRTPAAEQPYTLVAGRHRLHAVHLNEESEIDATIVDADKAEAQLIEITENLFRNELSVIDRAIFVATYRDVWEQKHGKIEVGRPGNRINLIQLFSDESQSGFSQHVAQRLGLSVPSVKRINFIAQHLHADVRTAVRGTAIADNQAALLKLAKMEPKKQRQMALAFGQEPDMKKAMVLVNGAKAKPSAELLQKAYEDDLVQAWKKADTNTRRLFLLEIGLSKSTADAAMIDIGKADATRKAAK